MFLYSVVLPPPPFIGLKALNCMNSTGCKKTVMNFPIILSIKVKVIQVYPANQRLIKSGGMGGAGAHKRWACKICNRLGP